MEKDKIVIKGARVHNLKNIDLELPKNKLIVFTGVSGSGKSSLAFDTIFAEGQRRYIESLSPYARQFLGQMDRPDVDDISGLSPAIAIDQKAHGHNPRSIVATLTEIYDYLRVLFARIGKIYCPVCGDQIKKLTVQEMVDIISDRAEEKKEQIEDAEERKRRSAEDAEERKRRSAVVILSPVVRDRKGEYYQLLYDFLQKGFSEAKIDGKFYSLRERIILSRYKNHNIDIVIDKVLAKDLSRLNEAVETAIEYSNGLVKAIFGENELLLSSKWTCPKDEFSFPEIEPRLFSFNSPHGACEACHGIGKEEFFGDEICPKCEGKRLKPESLSVKVGGKNIYETTVLTIDKSYDFFVDLESKLSKSELIIAKNILKEIISRLSFLLEVGLDYIALNREAATLSGGESQRIRLASQIGSKLSGALYVLDEPTIGLHERDNQKLVKTLEDLRDAGNTVIVVEHDETTINHSDFLADLGPGPGKHGGEVVAAGETKSLIKSRKKSLTLSFLRGDEKIEIPKTRRQMKETIQIIGANANNLKNINVKIPLRNFVCLTGVSGSGKSTLLYDVLYKNLHRIISRINEPMEGAAKILGGEYVDKIIEIDQSPIGRTPRSNPATYTGIFTPIRDFFSMLEAARERGYKPSRFSFNRPSGRCESCEGAGFNLVEMHFLPAILVQCDVCRGRRFNRETLEVKYKGKNIADILDLTVEESFEIFEDNYLIADKLKILKSVGLGYIQLGQSATTLSGGEAQRIKLAKELAKPSTRKTVYLLDEPTTGLHYYDIKMLLQVLQELVNKGNTVIVIEHNLHVIKTADYVIDLGPEGGDKGGKLIACGAPEEIIKSKESYTGHYLKKIFK